jgi:hypothetical protein
MEKDGSQVRLPAQELIAAGFRDLERGLKSVEALLVSIGAPRLKQAGLSLPEPIPMPEERLYDVLSEQYGDAAHSRYNALIRRLVSYERALARSEADALRGGEA